MHKRINAYNIEYLQIFIKYGEVIENIILLKMLPKYNTQYKFIYYWVQLIILIKNNVPIILHNTINIIVLTTYTIYPNASAET